MAIKAVLRKNTPDIQKRLKDLGFKCSVNYQHDLMYFESDQTITWWAGKVDTRTWDCGENEELFFYLISLNTLNNDEINHLSMVHRVCKNRLEEYRTENAELKSNIWKLECENDHLRSSILKTLEKLNDEKRK